MSVKSYNAASGIGSNTEQKKNEKTPGDKWCTEPRSQYFEALSVMENLQMLK